MSNEEKSSVSQNSEMQRTLYALVTGLALMMAIANAAYSGSMVGSGLWLVIATGWAVWAARQVMDAKARDHATSKLVVDDERHDLRPVSGN